MLLRPENKIRYYNHNYLKKYKILKKINLKCRIVVVLLATL